MKIFINGNKWATKQLNFQDWKPHEISEENFAKLKDGKIQINSEKTTDEKLVLISEKESEAIKKADEITKSQNKKMLEWGGKLKEYLKTPEVWFTLQPSFRASLTELFIFTQETGKFPSLELLGQADPDLFKYIKGLMPDKVPFPPESKK